MPKTLKNLYQAIIDFQNLLLASQKAQKGKRYRESTLSFNFDLERNLIKLHDELLAKTYEPGPYRDFIVEDSKKRLISAAPYRDRVVHHAIMNVIEPLLDRRFIFDTYACRKEKGTHAALLRFREFLGNHKYVLKCDIRKYFQTMDHGILMEKLCNRIADKDTLWLLEKIVESRDSNGDMLAFFFWGDDLFTPCERKRGIPVGNLTSQFFANLYLDDFDHWLKEEVRVGPYVRYVDDFCVFGDDKERLNAIKEMIVGRLAGIRLKIHDGKSRIYTKSEGVEFLGFRHLSKTVRVRRENVDRFRRRMKKLQRDFASGYIPLDRVRASLVSWTAHAMYADSERLRRVLWSRMSFSRKRERAELEPCVARRFLEQ
jgi:retron-type reverse transcriptase